MDCHEGTGPQPLTESSGPGWKDVWGTLGHLYILVPLEKLYNFGFPRGGPHLGGRPDTDMVPP